VKGELFGSQMTWMSKNSASCFMTLISDFFHLIGGIKAQRRRSQDSRLQMKAKDIVSYEHDKEYDEEKDKKKK
jgi:hypothetical protein